VFIAASHTNKLLFIVEKKTTVYPLINGLFSVRVKNKTGSAVCQPQMRVKWQDGKNTNNKAKLLRVAAS